MGEDIKGGMESRGRKRKAGKEWKSCIGSVRRIGRVGERGSDEWERGVGRGGEGKGS